MKWFLSFIIVVLALPLPCRAQDTLEGSHCIELGERHDLIEARNLVRTIAIRNAIESSGVLEALPPGSSRGMKEKILQGLRSGYVRDIEVLEHKETGDVICETIQAIADKSRMEEAVQRMLGAQSSYIEQHGIANNGCLKVLGVSEAEDRYGKRVEVATRVIRPTGALHTSRHRAGKHCFKVCIDYMAPSGMPMEGDSRFIDASAEGLVKGEIRTLSFYPPQGAGSYKIWLPGEKDHLLQPVEHKKTVSRKPAEQTETEDKAALSEKTRRLERITTKKSLEGLQVDLLADGPISEHRHFLLGTPARLVVDIPGKWKTPRLHVKEVHDRTVERIRIGRHSNKLRVVLDLSPGGTRPSAVFRETPSGLKIMIESP